MTHLRRARVSRFFENLHALFPCNKLLVRLTSAIRGDRRQRRGNYRFGPTWPQNVARRVANPASSALTHTSANFISHISARLMRRRLTFSRQCGRQTSFNFMRLYAAQLFCRLAPAKLSSSSSSAAAASLELAACCYLLVGSC